MIQAKPTVYITASDIIVNSNTTNYSVEIIHKPTGLVSECNRYKSTHKNRVEAILSLREMLSNFIQHTPTNKLVADN